MNFLLFSDFYKKGKTDNITSDVSSLSNVGTTVSKIPLALEANSERVKFMRITQALIDEPTFETLRKERVSAKRRGALDKKLEVRQRKEAEAAKSKKKKKKKKGKK